MLLEPEDGLSLADNHKEEIHAKCEEKNLIYLLGG